MKEQAKRERQVVMISDIMKRLFGDDENYIDEFFRKREAGRCRTFGKDRGRCFFLKDYAI